MADAVDFEETEEENEFGDDFLLELNAGEKAIADFLRAPEEMKEEDEDESTDFPSDFMPPGLSEEMQEMLKNARQKLRQR